LSGGRYGANLPERLEYDEGLPVARTSAFLAILDRILTDLASAIGDTDLHTVGHNTTIYNGRALDISIWQYLFQHITHQIHHQGQLSILLDELGLDHEFGNVFPLIPDAEQNA
jgi:uncharacterized damage-inducible protein DinB